MLNGVFSSLRELNGVFSVLGEMFSYAFLVRAVAVGALVSVCAALLGVSLVLKRYSMIGDGLSHTGFGSLALATALNAAPLLVSIPIVIAAAFLLLRLGEKSLVKGDAAIALVSTSSLALGVALISQTTGMNTDVCNYLFGSILAMSKADVRLSIALSITVLVLFVLFYHKLFAITFDETFARVSGIPAGIYNMLIAFLTAVTIVLGMRLMGAMLISALIIFPALTAMRVFKTFRSVCLCSAAVSIGCFFTGITLSYLYAVPAGASVVLVNGGIFLLFWLVKLFRERKGRGKLALAAALGVFLVSACGNPRGAAFSYGGGAASRGGPGPENQGALPKPGDTADLPGAAAGRAFPETAASLSLSAGAQAAPRESAPKSGVVEIKEKLFIAQTSDVYNNPEDYLGKTLKLEGLFKRERAGGREFCFVIRYGPGCCGSDGNAGFEVAWELGKGAPLQYPAADAWVEAQGVLRSYEEDGFLYLYLALSELRALDKRGAEYVTQ